MTNKEFSLEALKYVILMFTLGRPIDEKINKIKEIIFAAVTDRKYDRDMLGMRTDKNGVSWECLEHIENEYIITEISSYIQYLLNSAER